MRALARFVGRVAWDTLARLPFATLTIAVIYLVILVKWAESLGQHTQDLYTELRS